MDLANRPRSNAVVNTAARSTQTAGSGGQRGSGSGGKGFDKPVDDEIPF